MIRLICVGKIKEKPLQACIDEYRKRISAFTRFEIIEVMDEAIPNVHSLKQDEMIKECEGQKILSKIKEKDYVILLDLAGKFYSSEQLANQIERIMTYESSQITFVIGGSLGLSEKVIARSNMRFKLSECTFPHQLCRLIVCEQIYRSFTILNHLPYHK
ncbi:MAG: 23S rRNA (pseudouridine(1915)-N(3))-methyltransferase RlmH [Traorella sp.]